MEVRRFGCDRIPRKKMRVLGQIAAFIAVGTESGAGFRAEVRIEQAEEVHRDSIFRHPAIRRSDTPRLKCLLLIFVAETDAIAAIWPKPQLKAGIRIDLKVEIPVIIAEREEKFHAAVLMDRAERRGILGADSGFFCPLPNIQRGFIVAELLRHADAAVRFPQDAAHRYGRNGAPIRSAVGLENGILSHCRFPPR